MMEVDQLVRFCRRIGFTRDELIGADNIGELKYRKQVNASVLQESLAESLQSALNAFGKMLSLKIFIEGDEPLLDIRNGVVKNLEKAITEINQREPKTLLQVEISIGKQAIAGDHDLSGENLHVVYFIFHEALLRFLRGSSLRDLDQLLFKENAVHTVILVEEASYYYRGKLLSIVGLVDSVDISKLVYVNNMEDIKKQVAAYFKIAGENLSWTGFNLKNATPGHFMCICEKNGDENLTLELMNRLFCVCIIYTANRTSYLEESGSFEAVYASADRTSSLLVGRLDGISTDDQKILLQFAEWVYEGRPTDRLIILQNVAARELWYDDPAKNYEKLKKELRHVISDADRNYRIYTDGKIGRYFELSKSLSDYVSGITKDVSGTIDTITKGFVDSLYTTIGFIVATVIAALIKGETAGAIFGIGMTAYALYVLFFQLLYRMSSIYAGYSLLKKESHKRIGEYASHLYLSDSDLLDLKAPLKAWQDQFNLWFWVTVMIYILIIIALYWLSDPGHLSNIGIIGSNATPTPDLTPLPTSLGQFHRYREMRKPHQANLRVPGFYANLPVV